MRGNRKYRSEWIIACAKYLIYNNRRLPIRQYNPWTQLISMLDIFFQLWMSREITSKYLGSELDENFERTLS